MTSRHRWPHGHRFAFSIFDDTDGMTVQNGRPVYDLMTRLGLRVTKSVWPLGPQVPQTVGGDSCEDPDYLSWVRELQAEGHEIGYHHTSDHSSSRGRTLDALDRFEDLFGHAPRIGADHAGNRETLSAGPDRLSGWRSVGYRVTQRVVQPGRPPFEGSVPGSRWFWADLCRDRIKYWRGLTFPRTDLDTLPVSMPFHDPRHPYVNMWFLSCDAPRLGDLLERLASRQLDRLERNGGVCVLYTHLGLGAATGDHVHPRLAQALEDLAGRDGWFPPVSELLDHMLTSADVADRVITDRARSRLETQWVIDRLSHRVPLGPSVQTTHPT